ncbi:MAG: DNA (cytosine-5-)-methyltransferase [Clostridiaceae bacterium]
MDYKTIDLCAGIGGIRRGFELAGNFENIISAEIDEAACATYEHLYGDNPRNDVTSEIFKNTICSLNYDVLMAGFPCQTFSAVGLRKGFKDSVKGTIFFDIAEIIEKTLPKVVFLENVENLVLHDHGNTFKTILITLEKELNYKVIGVSYDENGDLKFNPKDFIRNSKHFGIPQNRPRVFIVAFSKDYFGKHVDLLPNKLPDSSPVNLYASLNEILEINVSPKYFLSSGYLETLEKHRCRQKLKGNGYGYSIVNANNKVNPIANTLLATGGSGKERNLIHDPVNGKKYTGIQLKTKLSPINDKFIRNMTPTEWGRLQGFIKYGFVDENHIDKFSFPGNLSDSQKYKQFGNSVTIPVIEQMALFIKSCITTMMNNFSETELKLFNLYGQDFKIIKLIQEKLGNKVRKNTLKMYFSLFFYFGAETEFKKHEIVGKLGFSSAQAAKMIEQLLGTGCFIKNRNGTYSFKV